jgi:hypothetical protein
VHSFEIPDMSPGRFVDDVVREIARRGLEGYVSVRLDGGELVARISHLGTTILRYVVSGTGNGFTATLYSRRVAPLHAPFRTAFESALERVVSSLGGSVTNG